MKRMDATAWGRLAWINFVAGVLSTVWAMMETITRGPELRDPTLRRLEALPAGPATPFTSSGAGWVVQGSGHTGESLELLPAFAVARARIAPREGVAVDDWIRLLREAEASAPAWRVQACEIESGDAGTVHVRKLEWVQIRRVERSPAR